MLPWTRRSRSPARARQAPLAEAMEPRLLFSADLAAAWLPQPDPAVAEAVRTLDAPQQQPVLSVQAVAQAFATTQLPFEANAGQFAAGVDFAARGNGYAIDLAGGQARIFLNGAEAPVSLQLVGAQAMAGQGEGLLAMRSNYLLGEEAAQWHTDIPNYASVLYQGVYQGVDLRYYGTQSELEYDFLLAAGADPGQIALRFGGVAAQRLQDGDLVLQVAGSGQEIRFRAPVAYQLGPAGREAVASRYELAADGTVRFSLGAYDASRALVIDPVLAYATYFGGAGSESALGIAVGSDGAVYVTGRTLSTSGDLTPRIGSGGVAGGDIYVAKFTADLSSLVYATRIGGTGDEQGNAIAVASDGAVVVTGWTRSAGLLGSGGSISGGQDAFVVKLNAAGNAAVFVSVFGGSGGADAGTAVAVDAAGQVYASGLITDNTLVGGVLGLLLGNSDNAFLFRVFVEECG